MNPTDPETVMQSPLAPVPQARPVKPPALTDREWKCVAWLIASIAWIPPCWTGEIGSLAKKMRAYLGDDAVSDKAKP